MSEFVACHYCGKPIGKEPGIYMITSRKAGEEKHSHKSCWMAMRPTEIDRVRAERDALSRLLRGMARRSVLWRRLKRYEVLEHAETLAELRQCHEALDALTKAVKNLDALTKAVKNLDAQR